MLDGMACFQAEFSFGRRSGLVSEAQLRNAFAQEHYVVRFSEKCGAL
jgi:hypothetical protein